MTIPKNRRTDEGLTLVETLAALAIFLIVAGFMIPLFAKQNLDTIDNEIKTGAVAASQQILDRLRQIDTATLPNSGTFTTFPSGDSLSSVVMNKTYSATVSYCPTTPTDPYCGDNARHIKVQVNYNGQNIYTVATVYTRLQ